MFSEDTDEPTDPEANAPSSERKPRPAASSYDILGSAPRFTSSQSLLLPVAWLLELLFIIVFLGARAILKHANNWICADAGCAHSPALNAILTAGWWVCAFTFVVLVALTLSSRRRRKRRRRGQPLLGDATRHF